MRRHRIAAIGMISRHLIGGRKVEQFGVQRAPDRLLLTRITNEEQLFKGPQD
jgi:hypothetical protein